MEELKTGHEGIPSHIDKIFSQSSLPDWVSIPLGVLGVYVLIASFLGIGFHPARWLNRKFAKNKNQKSKDQGE